MNETITLYRFPSGWMAKFSDPNRAMRRVLGTSTLSTAFPAHASAEEVKAEIQRRNPKTRVVVSASSKGG